jgi:hypothetical protein
MIFSTGEYDPEKALTRASARSHFLAAIRDCELREIALNSQSQKQPNKPNQRAYRVLSNLRGKLLDLYTKAQFDYPVTWSDFRSDILSIFEEPTIKRLSREALKKALIAWARKWNLIELDKNPLTGLVFPTRETEWILDQALLTLALWQNSPADCAALNWSPYLGEWWKATFNFDTDFILVFKSHTNLIIEKRKTAETRIQKEFDEFRKEFKKRLELHFDYLDKMAQEGDIPKPEEKRSLLHFEMLIRYQIQYWTHAEICTHYKYKDVSRVAHIIPETAELIGLTLRKGRGRPRKH